MLAQILDSVRRLEARDRERSDMERRLAAREAYARGLTAGQQAAALERTPSSFKDGLANVLMRAFEERSIADYARPETHAASDFTDAELDALLQELARRRADGAARAGRAAAVVGAREARPVVTTDPTPNAYSDAVEDQREADEADASKDKKD